AVPATYDSDTLWSYELGAKDSFFERRLALQASVYYINWTNIQKAVNLPSCGQNFTTNRSKAVSRGFDLQLAAVVTGTLSLTGTVGYTDAYYPKASFGAPINGVSPLLNGAGDKLADVLPWTASLHADYVRSIGRLWDGAKGYVRADYRYLSGAPRENPLVANYDPGLGPFPNEAYKLLNVRMGVMHAGWDVSAYINNATSSNPRLGLNHPV